MFSADGRYLIVYNGEIYNFREIRELLDGSGSNTRWRSKSDTEVILGAYAGGVRVASSIFTACSRSRFGIVKPG